MMMTPNHKAVVLGATGLTGSLLLELLLQDDHYTEVIVLSRKPLKVVHAKLRVIEMDLLDLSPQKEVFQNAAIFVCIGTTQAKTPDKKTYKAIDYGIPYQAAQLGAAVGATALLIVSAMGANPKSRVFYNRIKGEMERDTQRAGIAHTYLFRPALISGPRQEHRFGERAAEWLMKLLQPIVPKAYRSIQAATIAKAMLAVSKTGHPQSIIENQTIKELG